MLLLAAGFALSVGPITQMGWPSVGAEVLGWRVVREERSDRPGGPVYAAFRPEIRYRYLDGDVSKEATTLADRWSKSAGPAEALARKYPEGSRPRISSDPNRPSEIRFDVGLNMSTLWKPIAAWFAALLLALLAWKTRRADHDRSARTVPSPS